MGPRGNRYSGSVYLDCFYNAKYIYVAIEKVHTASGKTIDYKPDKWDYKCWEAD